MFIFNFIPRQASTSFQVENESSPYAFQEDEEINKSQELKKKNKGNPVPEKTKVKTEIEDEDSKDVDSSIAIPKELV